MPTITEYAKVEGGVVTSIIVAGQSAIDAREDGPWTLTPYNGSTGKVGIGYQCDGGLFLASIRSSLTLAETDPLNLSIRAVASVAITYQWKKDNADMLGKTDSTLTIASVSLGDAGSYTCLVTSGDDSAESTTCTVTVS